MRFGNFRTWFGRGGMGYARRTPLILINGLAEQPESWFCNVEAWRAHFDVHMPRLLVYEGACLHHRIAADLPIDIPYLVAQLHKYLAEFAQDAPYHFVANSLGGKVAVEYAVRYPDDVDRLVLLCPSGLCDEERLPIVDGVRRNDPLAIVRSVFADPRHVDRGLVTYYQRQFANRRWRAGLLRTVRGTMNHRVRDLLSQVRQPTMVVVGREDRIVDPTEAMAATSLLPNGELVVLENCGHAPQIEKADEINRLVLAFLNQPRSAAPLAAAVSDAS